MSASYTPPPGTTSDPYMYGSPYLSSQYAKLQPWEQGFARGLGTGRSLFYDDPDMQASRARLEDLQKGYNGEQLGAMRESARQGVAGQRTGYMNQLRSNLARQGVGGARGAAMQGAADQRFAQTGAENERKMALDNAAMVQKGTTNLNDYLMKQKLGQVTTAGGFSQMAAAQYAADRGAQNANSADKGVLNQITPNGRGGLGDYLLNPLLGQGETFYNSLFGG